MNAGISDKVVNTAGNEPSESTIEYGSIFRFSKTKFSNFSKDGQPIKINSLDGSFIQAGFFGSLGGDVIGVAGQFGWLYPIADDANRPSYSPLFISIGLRFIFW